MEASVPEMKPYRINPACIEREVGGRRLIIVYPEAAKPYYLEVNESLFYVFRAARDLGLFDENDVAAIIERGYGLSEELARKESVATIALWKQHGLLEEP